MSRFNLKLVKSDLTAQENFKQLFEETNPLVFDEYTFGLPTSNPDHEKGLFPDPEKLKNRNTSKEMITVISQPLSIKFSAPFIQKIAS